jgi:AraC-like DNA-binding protein/tetratricopeptide (TPR) repeat protein
MNTSLSGMIRLFILFVLLFAQASPALAQKPRLNPDQLFKEVRSMLPNELDKADSLALLLYQYARETPMVPDSVKAKSCYLMGMVQYYKSRFLLSATYYQEALDTDYARKTSVFAEACYNNLGIVQEKRGEHQKALKAYYQSLRLAESLGDSGSITQTWINISLLEGKNLNYERAVRIGKDVLDFFQRAGDSLNMGLSHQNLAFFYSNQPVRFDSSVYHFQRANQLFAGLEKPYFLIGSQVGYASLLSGRRMYVEARTILEQMLTLSKQQGMDDKEALICLHLSELTMNAGMDVQLTARYLEASRQAIERSDYLNLMPKYKQLKLRYLARIQDYTGFDQLLTLINEDQAETVSKQTREAYEELKMQYEVDKLSLQAVLLQKDVKRRNDIILIIGLAMGIIAIALLWIVLLYRRQQENLNTMYQMNLQLARQQIMASVAVVTSEDDKLESLQNDQSEDDNDLQQVLYRQIVRRIEEQRLYDSPAFSIHDLSELLNRNRKVISRCLTEVGKTSFSTLINEYRVNEARRLLMEQGHELSINDIGEQCGFGNRISFYRNFKEATGFSPTAYLERFSTEQANVPTEPEE